MKCPKCGSENVGRFRYCMSCGAELELQPRKEEPRTGEEETPKPQDRLEMLTESMRSGEAAEDAAEDGAEEEIQTPRRSRRREPDPEEEPEAPAAEKERPRNPAPARESGSRPAARYAPPARKLPPPRERGYRRSGRGVWFWLAMLVIVLCVLYIGACVLMPDHPVTAPGVNLGLTVWNYLSASWKDMLWFLIALGALIVLALLKALLGGPVRRRIHAEDLAEAQDLAGRVVVVETLAPPHQVHAEIEEILKNRKTRRMYFPKGKLTLEEYAASGVPLEYACGKDRFTANFVFQRMDRNGTRIFMEVIEWQLNNGIVSRRCVQAMRGLEPMLRDAVLDIDSRASIQVYDR